MKVLEILAGTFAQAIGMMVSPLSMIAMVVVLMGPKPVPKGVVFSLGWISATLLLIYGAIRMGLANASAHPTMLNGIIDVVVGALFLFLAIKNFKTGWADRAHPSAPAWIEKMATMSLPAVFGVSFGLAITNVKNIPIAAQVVAKVSILGPVSHSQAIITAVLFVLITAIPFLTPTLWIMLRPEAAHRFCSRSHDLLIKYEHFIMGALFLMMGAQAFGGGIQIVIARST